MWVLDTSVAVKWFFTDETGREKSTEILHELVENPDLFLVPDLFFQELSAVLIRKSKFQREFVKESLETVYSLGIQTISLGQELSAEAISLSCLYRISYYDAHFLALAEGFKGVWLTADQKAVRKLSKNLALHFSLF